MNRHLQPFCFLLPLSLGLVLAAPGPALSSEAASPGNTPAPAAMPTGSRFLIEAVVLQVSPSLSGGAGAFERSLTNAARVGVINLGTNSAGGQPGFRYLATGRDLDRLAGFTNSAVRILERPRAETPAGVTASFFVGRPQPVPNSGGKSGARGLLAGLSLDVTPSVDAAGRVVLEVHAKLDHLSGTTTLAGTGEVPIITSTEAEATICVQDGDRVLLGGLMETVEAHASGGVPGLRSLPLVGKRFRGHADAGTPVELVIILRPTRLPQPPGA